jgi:hypothetical protein
MRFKHLIFFDFGLLVQSLLKKFFFSFSKLVSNLGGSGNQFVKKPAPSDSNLEQKKTI